MLDFLEINYFVNVYFPKPSNENLRSSVIINGDGRIMKWMDLIGSKNVVKVFRFRIWDEFGLNPTNTTLQQRKDILSGDSDKLL